MTQRIKGQEVTLSWTSPRGDQDGMEYVLNFEFELDLEILEEEFLGQTAKSFDDIYHGVKGKAELQLASPAFLTFSERVQDRAERRESADGVFTATCAFAFPNGQRVRVQFPNLFFGPIPHRVGGRSEYVTVNLDWACERIRRIL